MKLKSAGRKLFSVDEAYIIMYRTVRSLPGFLRAQKNGTLPEDFSERIMLAVTEVNKCPVCSYAHTKMALSAGMSIEEINAMLSGDISDAGPDEIQAILFAQHYADSRGRPSKEAWDTVIRHYGNERSAAILGAIRMIMLGNAYGIPSGSFAARFSKKEGKAPDPRSSIWYEIAMLSTMIVFVPCTLMQAFCAAIINLPLTNFGHE